MGAGVNSCSLEDPGARLTRKTAAGCQLAGSGTSQKPERKSV